MSLNPPRLIVTLGNVNPPQADVIELNVHLGATKEVSSFELLLQNWNSKYSTNGTYPIVVGQLGGIGLGRCLNTPPLISLKIETVKYTSTPFESYVRVGGRCWGEKLFRRIVTKTYENQKGEEIVKDLLESFAELGHNRSTTELVENTDTTYTKLEYVDTPVMDILKSIASSSDRGGVIGFDFRVAPDGKFEFFPISSKLNGVELGGSVESSEYSKDITAVRNRVTIYGAADKSYPANKDAWTEILSPLDGQWFATAGEAAQDDTKSVKGAGSIKCHVLNNYFGGLRFTLNDGKEANANLYPELGFFAFIEDTFRGTVNLVLVDVNGRTTGQAISMGADESWHDAKVTVGSKKADSWSSQVGFDWSRVKTVQLSVPFDGVGSGDFWVDGLFFGGRRFSAVEQDIASQNTYGLRELSDIDEELYSDNECMLRAKAVVAKLKDPAEALTIKSTVIDYGVTPFLAGDRVHAVLPNENVDAEFRVVSVEYFVDGRTQELEVTLELGRETLLLADWVYALRSKVNQINKYKISK